MADINYSGQYLGRGCIKYIHLHIVPFASGWKLCSKLKEITKIEREMISLTMLNSLPCYPVQNSKIMNLQGR